MSNFTLYLNNKHQNIVKTYYHVENTVEEPDGRSHILLYQ